MQRIQVNNRFYILTFIGKIVSYLENSFGASREPYIFRLNTGMK